MDDLDPDPDLTAQQVAHREYLARTSMEVWKPETPPRAPEGIEVFAAWCAALAALIFFTSI